MLFLYSCRKCVKITETSMHILITGMKSGGDIDTNLLITTAKKIEQMSMQSKADRKQITEKSLSLLGYLDEHTQVLDTDSSLRSALERCCWVLPSTTPTQSKDCRLPFLCSIPSSFFTG